MPQIVNLGTHCFPPWLNYINQVRKSVVNTW